MSQSYSRGRGQPWSRPRGRGRGNRSFSSTNDGDSTNQASSASRPSDRGGGFGRPRGLRGKEIGLYYRDMGKKKREEHKEKANAEMRDKLSCTLTPDLQQRLMNVTDQLKELDYNNDVKNIKFQEQYESNLIGNQTAELAIGSDTEFDKLENYSNYNDKDEYHWLFRSKWDPEMNETLKSELLVKQQEPSHQSMLGFRKTLPAYKLQNEIVDKISKNQIVVISGETGCGKTTQVAQYILDSEIMSGRGSVCNIVCTQPRRISAITVAERVAQERQERIGKSVGYCIRLENRTPSRQSGIITFMTTGIIFRCLRSNKTLDGISHLILDEIHERSIHSDFLITLLKDILVRRPTLKVILMSATLNAAEFSAYYDHAPVVTIPGFTFPVKTYYLEDAIEQTKFVFNDPERQTYYRRNYDDFIESYIYHLRDTREYSEHVLNQISNSECENVNIEFIEALITNICDTDKNCGAILVFLTGWDMISKLSTELTSNGKFPTSRYRIFPLHSMMPTVNQREIFERPPRGVRKIILATQIAETSITIDDVVFVIDCGKIKISNFDETSNLATLNVEWVSKANAIQRRGRAGRVQAGVVYHLFSRAREQTLEPYTKPEVLRTRLEEVILQVKMLELGKAEFLKRLLDPPSIRAVELALERLVELHAIDADEQLTPLGFHLARLPMDPQTGKMILMGALFSCLDPIFSIAACLSFKDPFYMPLGKEHLVDALRQKFSGSSKSDHVVYVKVLKEYEDAVESGYGRQYAYKHFLSESTLRMLLNMKKQFAEYLQQLGFLPSCDFKNHTYNKNSNNMSIVKAVTASGLYPNVAVVELMRGSHAILRSEGKRVEFHPSSVNSRAVKFASPYIVYYKKVKSTAIFIFDASMVNPLGLIFFGGNLEWKCENQNSENMFSVRVDGKYDLVYPEGQNFRTIFESLRAELDNFLQFKSSNPGPTDWSTGSKENLLINAIIDVLTSEYEAFHGPAGDSDEEDHYPPLETQFNRGRRY